jgi:uncharacterized repeat protein (TIGR03803 family)
MNANTRPMHPFNSIKSNGGVVSPSTRWLWAILLVCFTLVVPLLCRAAVKESRLHSFSGCEVYQCSNGDRDGLDPTAPLVADSAGNLYGTTQYGGIFGTGCYPYTCSTVFELKRSGTTWTKSTIYFFRGIDGAGGADGSYTISGLLIANGALYGTTYQGGEGTQCINSAGCGTVFRLTPPAPGQALWNETILYNFSGALDGSTPCSSLIADASGALYGTFRGDNTRFAKGNDFGGVFKLTPPSAGKTAWTESVISTFDNGANGGQPVANLIADARGNLYGVVLGNINQGEPSTIFKLTPRDQTRTTWTTTILHSFVSGAPEGSYPQGGVVMDAKGNLYTTTSNGAGKGCNFQVGCGTVFELSPPANGGISWKVTVLHTFTGGPDGGTSEAGLAIDAAGNLFGTTRYGGSTTTYSIGSGVIFEVTAAKKFSVLYEYEGYCCSSIYGQHVYDGQFSYAAPLLWNGSVFTTTTSGGLHDLGGVFELSP